MSIRKIITQSADETKKIAVSFGERMIQRKLGTAALVLALSGDLGAGKTTFLQGFAEGLGITEVVNSPTFIIMRKFQIPNHKLLTTNYQLPTKKYFYHFDCYRIGQPEDILSLGFKEIISNPENMVAIEWPEKIERFLPMGALKINFNHLEEDQREVIIDLP